MTNEVGKRREESILKESSSLASPKTSTWILQQRIDLVKCHSPIAFLLPSRCGVDLTYPVLVDKKDIASVRAPLSTSLKDQLVNELKVSSQLAGLVNEWELTSFGVN